ncbi:hypothetical protein DM01DRAFT_1385040 [Hesseltinella vesiculosa]|uniref:RING-type domain-containing protein n=1 Tax=Hesseltinella vesiculosa TaxID=101127 RepID=A0A1X2GBK0_9FUNG|nr:hypothetical protein DM01DRAFT_1385040 [Hesseltinella vesiculosa]
MESTTDTPAISSHLSQPDSTIPHPSHTVRTHWLQYIGHAWNRISRTSKILISTVFTVSLIQIIITIAMLIIGRQESCDKPLNVYLIVFVIRLSIALPLMLYQYLRPTGYRNRQQPQLSPPAPATTAIPDSPVEPSTSTSPSVSSLQIPSASSPQTSPNRPLRPFSHILNYWIDRLKSLLDVLSILWFIVGNYFLFTASYQCHSNASHLFYTTLAWILLGYFLILIPLLICTAAIFCLPCLLIFLRAAHVDYTTGMIGASKSDIDKVSTYRFQAPPDIDHAVSNDGVSNKQTPSVASVPIQRHRNWIERIAIKWTFGRNRNKAQVGDENNLAALDIIRFDPVDAVCTICLCDYETDELICQLRCNHHFHRDCLHEWLALNYKCPLCQRDFRKPDDE